MTQDGVIKPEDVRQLVRKEPFAPFRIHMSDGATLDVPHPEFVWIQTRFVHIAVPGERQGLVQDIHVCAILHITRLEVLDEAG